MKLSLRVTNPKTRSTFLHAATLMILHGAVHAQSVTGIGDAALAGSSGRIAVNASAGVGNAQSNLAAIATGDGAQSGLRSTQSAPTLSDGLHAASASIDGAAFSAVRGAIAVNQASGDGNAQANLLALSTGTPPEVSFEQLDSVTGTTPPAATQADGRALSAHVSDSAFTGAGGIVQVNQAAGAGNRTANVFALSIAPQ